jgi:acid phosphatase
MLRDRIRVLAVAAITCCAAGGCAASGPALTATPTAPAATSGAPVSLPRPAHVVVVIEENHSAAQIIGSASATYINALAAGGASFSNSHAITHPSEPNYLALFSGSAQGVSSDDCPQRFAAPSLGAEALSAGLTFSGYSESMPSDGFTGCTSGEYARKHNPWSDFPAIPRADNRTLADFPASFAALPTISFVVPNLLDDMHDGTVAQGDAWLRKHLSGYAQWARSHHSLLIVTWDENDGSPGNQIATIVAGAGVKPGTYRQDITHYNVLRTIEDCYGLPHAGASASAAPLAGIFAS